MLLKKLEEKIKIVGYNGACRVAQIFLPNMEYAHRKFEWFENFHFLKRKAVSLLMGKSDECIWICVPIISTLALKLGKVEKILKGRRDSAGTQSHHLQGVMNILFFLIFSKTLLGVVNKHFRLKSLLTTPNNTPQANFPANNLNFHWRWRQWDQN